MSAVIETKISIGGAAVTVLIDTRYCSFPFSYGSVYRVILLSLASKLSNTRTKSISSKFDFVYYITILFNVVVYNFFTILSILQHIGWF